SQPVLRSIGSGVCEPLGAAGRSPRIESSLAGSGRLARLVCVATAAECSAGHARSLGSSAFLAGPRFTAVVRVVPDGLRSDPRRVADLRAWAARRADLRARAANRGADLRTRAAVRAALRAGAANGAADPRARTGKCAAALRPGAGKARAPCVARSASHAS